MQLISRETFQRNITGIFAARSIARCKIKRQVQAFLFISDRFFPGVSAAGDHDAEAVKFLFYHQAVNVLQKLHCPIAAPVFGIKQAFVECIEDKDGMLVLLRSKFIDPAEGFHNRGLFVFKKVKQFFFQCNLREYFAVKSNDGNLLFKIDF